MRTLRASTDHNVDTCEKNDRISAYAASLELTEEEKRYSRAVRRIPTQFTRVQIEHKVDC